MEKYGLSIPYYTKAPKLVYPKAMSAMPISKIKSEASYGGKSVYTNIKFNNFKSNITYCGMRQAIIGANIFGTDYHPRLLISKSTFNNVN